MFHMQVAALSSVSELLAKSPNKSTCFGQTEQFDDSGIWENV